ncbi:MAG TPA: hypothetical protein VKV35_02795 [Streptosporangiaceae bacterium]|nr:hypothetical protein [Streptosporangiaceae bacterium]
MRVLPDVVGARRLLAAAAALAALTSVAGCAQFDAALGQRQAVVSFRAGTTLAQKLQVRKACQRPPAVTAQPLPPGLRSASALPQVTYQVTRASDAQVAQLQECLSRFPAVAGVTLQDASDQGS